jgi:DNA polymerase III epsilon subunit-like protein
MPKHLNGVMFDLETAGKQNTSAIVSFGACFVDFQNFTISDKILINVSVTDAIKNYKMGYDSETMKWWADLPKEVAKLSTQNALPFEEAMNEIYTYLVRYKGQKLWAWGPHFDVACLENNLRAKGVKQMPWKYWDVLDARTVLNVFGEEIKRSDNHHSALDDAVDQAKYLLEFIKSLNSFEEDVIPF